MNYWLLKTEPDECSIDDLASLAKPMMWDGIRNYQARNIIRDQIAQNDIVLIYHSSCKQVGIYGLGKVVRAAYLCPHQFDPLHRYFDSRAQADSPRWYVMDIEFAEKFKQPVLLPVIKSHPLLQEMALIKQGRLSVQPVTAAEFKTIQSLAKG